ncbi:MAG TPA: trypsin-like peptidase domain-containing protein [Nocardioides sp.]|uniref:trypsin-like serine peptidase n=1 Tax=uncultured Nocardioides sp. TaxID=198441 RepID=UPI002617A94A|nr:trypsin-like peptidase domain-containing protein [uncultured Nocardioides sp.]HRD61014.1 trypsin-like peptidase domain-containing protein [Nocardioides sp.]HRI94921.1 trypsin-like peptidase domain-containing protein [Nocardioides sp.]HRK44975.1 trypsin-like peptidase domain-containing protein [Nocardioides sp.]
MPDLPMSWDELLRLEPQPARQEIPEELRGYAPDPVPTRTIRRVERATAPAAAGAKSDRAAESVTNDGYCPPWVATSPKPARRRFTPPPEVWHRGERLNPLYIVGPDNRTAYNDLSYPWGCVCKITTAAGARGSGVLIGPRHVLTASHCVDWGTDAAEKIEVHLQGTVAAATTFDTAAYAFTHISGNPSSSTVDEDYAVLVLADRLGDRFGWFGTKTYDSGWDDEGFWTTIGYPGDGAFGTQFPTFQNGVWLDEDEFDYGSGRAMTTNADVKPGQSGSPFFGMWNEGGTQIAYAVAVVSAEGEIFLSGNENWASGGSDLGRIVRQARDENP